MPNDGGLLAVLEQWFADQLAALTFGGNKVFKTADVWRHQVGPTAGGLEAFVRYAPFAFASYQSDDAAREGSYDLRQIPDIAVLIGVESQSPGVARTGDASHVGTSKLRDLVITLFDRKDPGGGLGCDEVYYTGAVEVVDSPRCHALQLTFEISKLTESS